MKIGRVVTSGYALTSGYNLNIANFQNTRSIKRFEFNQQAVAAPPSFYTSLTFSGSSFPLDFCVWGGGASSFSYPNLSLAEIGTARIVPGDLDLPFYGGQSLKERVNDRGDLILLVPGGATAPASASRSFNCYFSSPNPLASENFLLDIAFLHWGFWITTNKIPYESITWTPSTRRFSCTISGYTDINAKRDLELLLHGERETPIMFFDDYQVLENTFNFQLVIVDDFSFSIRAGDIWTCDLSGFAI